MNKVFLVIFLISNLNAGSIFAEQRVFYSQFQQDKYVYENFFRNKSKGVFVDVCAHDGISLSNTYFFEKSLGWTCICIEPIHEVFELLKINRKCQ